MVKKVTLDDETYSTLVELKARLGARSWRELATRLRELASGAPSGGATPERIEISEEELERLVKRIERRIDDILNPFTAKVDQLHRLSAEIQERVESLEEKVSSLEKRVQELEKLLGAKRYYRRYRRSGQEAGEG